MRQNRRTFEIDQSTKEAHFVIEGNGMYMKAWGRLSQNNL